MTKKRYRKRLAQRNMFLEKELGFKKEEYGINHILFTDKNSKKRFKKFYKEKKRYGFTSYDTWDLSHNFAEYMYSHLSMYLKEATIINLDYYKFEYKGREYTQKEVIKLIMKDCAYFLKHQYDEKEIVAYKAMTEAYELWTLVYGYMWW